MEICERKNRRDLIFLAVKKKQDLFDKTIALTKQVYLRKPDGPSSRLQFRPGDGQTPGHFRVGGGYVTWWFTKQTRKIIDDLVLIAGEIHPELRYGNRESLAEIVTDVLKDNGFNTDIFEPDPIFFGDVDTLFEARRISNVQAFGNVLLAKIEKALRASISTWLIVFPLLRIKSSSWIVAHDGLRVISPHDEATWLELASQYSIDDWNPIIGGTEKTSFKRILKDVPFCWLACEVQSGTMDSAREIAARKMRMFIAILFARFHLTSRHALTKSMMQVTGHSVQFPSQNSGQRFTQIIASIGMLLPPLLSDFEITPNDVTQVNAWYRRLQATTNEKRARLTAAGQFLNYGIVADGLERFIHFFIALDALFGVRGNVEETISNGLKGIFPADLTWEYRASRLFDLRSTLVHGGCATIDEWKDLSSYRKHTGSDPLKDVTEAAIKSLWEYVNLQ
ncbi:MAG TPA: hypothetical protein VE863_20160 [Pyrinomonadaceae bacterium]|nr:hypothetical protein [Pyrinomonadaceae bacterium]